MTDRIEILRGDQISTEFENEWASLFARAYRSTEAKGHLLLRKYKRNASRLCVLYVDGRIVGSYSGLELPFAEARVFLSTDTMSDGTRAGVSVILGTHLYESLTDEGFLAVCGYPNDKIRKLRERRLSWIIDGELYLWIGIPLLWRISWYNYGSNLWKTNRPEGGFFGYAIPGINLVGRNGLLRRGPGLAATLSAQRPGFFFLRVPSKLFAPRTFGYRLLSGSKVQQETFLNSIDRLDLETIDLP